MKYLPLFTLFTMIFLSGCVHNKQSTMTQHHEKIVTDFWEKNEENLTHFFKTYEAYNSEWRHELELEKKKSKIILSNVIEAKVTNEQRGHINQMMADYNIPELSFKIGQRDRSIFYDFRLTETGTNTEEKAFDNSTLGLVYTYIIDEERDFTVDLMGYRFSKDNTNPKNIRVKMDNKNGEVVFYMPIL